MTVVSTKGLKVWLQKSAATITPIPLTPTAITKAHPPSITVDDTAGVHVGDIALFGTVGFSELDNKPLAVSAVTDATAFTVAGADTTDSTGALSATPTVEIYGADSLCELCLSVIDIPSGSQNPISIATFCKPSASVPGNPSAGTVTFTGFVDVEDPCYPEMLAAVDDGLPRLLKIDLPGGNGYIIGEVILGAVSYALPLEGAAGFTFTGTQSTPMEHVF